MKKIYFISAALLAGVSMSAQNLNPTVSVTRAYEGKLLDVHKPMEKMFVPDSLNKFDLDFDYSVFENPYKGAYDFKPYTMNMKPQAEAYSGKKFYLKAGAGYNLRPSVDAVLEPLTGEKFRMGVYASHHSYFGNYKELGFNDKMNLSSTGTKQSGYDMYSTVGVDGRAYLNKAALTFDVGYLGIHTDDPLECSPVSQHSSTGYNAAKLAFRLKGENTSESYLYYDMAMKYRFGAQGFGGMPALSGTSGEYLSSLNMNDLDFSITLGPVFKQYHKVVADFGMGMTWYTGLFDASVGNAFITPKYVFEKNRWIISAGVKIGFKMTSGEDLYGRELNTNKGTMIYPDVRIGFTPIKDYMNLYVTATGGDWRNPYYELKERNHFFIPLVPTVMSNNSVERYNLALGFSGNIASRFRYDVKVGYRSFESMPMDYVLDALISAGKHQITGYGIAYEDGTAVYSDLKMQWESKDFALDSWFRINAVDFKNADAKAFEPARYSGGIDATYNWRRRLFFGASVEFASRRAGKIELPAGLSNAYVPAWVDLGVHAEYAFTRKLSFWVRGENLLDMNIQRTVLYTTGGIGFTAGICLNL